MSPPLAFRHRDSQQHLNWGELFAAPPSETFRDTPSAEMQALVQAIESGEPWRKVVDQAFAAQKPWLHAIITSPARTAFFGRVLPDSGGMVLDIGAGWGQISRPLAGRRQVVAIEPGGERLAFIRAAAVQDGVRNNIAFIQADYLDVQFETPFSAICAIGVLEWAGAFQSSKDPQHRQREFLEKARADLSAGGHLVLGIENRLGLKYLLGCPDDHIGVAGVACLPAALARSRWHQSSGDELRSFTYSASELTALLKEAGFSTIEFFAAFPDYKLTEALVPFGSRGQLVNEWLTDNEPPREHNGYDGTLLPDEFQEALRAQYRSLADDRVAHAFVPSFFVRATA